MSLEEPYVKGGLGRAARAAGTAFGWQEEAESEANTAKNPVVGGLAMLSAGAAMIGLTLYFWLA